jgi:hypothetical protein
MAKTIVCLVDSSKEAEGVVSELMQSCGCDRSDIGLMARDSEGEATGGLVKLGVPEHEAHYYAEGVRRGGTLVTVRARTDEAADCAAQVMRNHGAAGKQSTQREKTVRGTIRKTDVRAENAARGAKAAYTGPERRRRKIAFSGLDRRVATQ